MQSSLYRFHLFATTSPAPRLLRSSPNDDSNLCEPFPAHSLPSCLAKELVKTEVSNMYDVFDYIYILPAPYLKISIKLLLYSWSLRADYVCSLPLDLPPETSASPVQCHIVYVTHQGMTYSIRIGVGTEQPARET